MKNKVIYIWLLITTILPFNFFANTPYSDRDDLVSAVRAPKSVVPGQFETFILELKNDYAHPLRLDVEVEKPSSWHFLSPLKIIELEPGQSKQVIFLLEIDRSCEIGKKQVLFRFTDQQYQVQLQEMILTEVENVHLIKVNTLQKPKNISSGQRYKVDFEIHNLGNCEEEVSVSSIKGILNPQTLIIPPNSRRFISVEQVVPKNLSHAGYISSDLNLRVSYQEEPIREIASVKAFPKATQRTDPYHRFPLQASLIYFGARNNAPYESSLQFELIGDGHIDRNKRHHLNFIVRAPNRFAIARVGNYDRYSAEYNWQRSRTASTSIRVGDFAYNLTEVTEMYRWARGMELKFNDEKYEVGGFINKPRFIADVDYQYAAWGRYHINSQWFGQASLMQKHYGGDSGVATLSGLQTGLELDKHRFTGEISTGTLDGKTSIAGQLTAQGQFESFQYNTRNLYSGPDYPGFYTNSYFSSTTLQYRKRRWGLNANLYYNASNPVQDTIQATAPYSRNYNAGVSYFPTSNLQMRADYLYRFREDRMPTKKFMYLENGVRFRTTFRNQQWLAQINGEAAQTENLLIASDDNTGSTYNLSLQAEKNLLKDFRLGVRGQYLNTNRYDVDQRSYLLYGGSISYQPSKHFGMRASYQNNYLIEEYYRDRSLIDVGLNARYAGHQFRISTSHALVRRSESRTDFYINARYTYHFSPPISKRDDLYSLQGQISSAEPKDAAGVILTINGQSVISDEYGYFTVHNLPVGIHYLHIDWGSVGVGMVTNVESPLEVEILPRPTNKVTFELMRGGNISGNIKFLMDARDRREMPKNPLKVIKISNGRQEYLSYTDENGDFSFLNILPGEWTVRVVNPDDGSGSWQLEQNNLTVKLNPAEAQSVQFVLKKRTRQIRFSDKSLNIKMKKQ